MRVFSCNSEYPVDGILHSSCENQQISPSITADLPHFCLGRFIDSSTLVCPQHPLQLLWAACDHTLCDDLDLVNHMCVLTITRDDSTPFDADSLQEKDIVELCVGVDRHTQICAMVISDRFDYCIPIQ